MVFQSPDVRTYREVSLKILKSRICQSTLKPPGDVEYAIIVVKQKEY